MRVRYDTNVLISMILFPSLKFKRMHEYIIQKHKLVISSFIIEELEEVAERKFPNKKDYIDNFLAKTSYEFVYTPHNMQAGMFEIRDINDYPVLYTAIVEDIDVLITGDRDFLEVDIEKPEVLTPTGFVEQYTMVD